MRTASAGFRNCRARLLAVLVLRKECPGLKSPLVKLLADGSSRRLKIGTGGPTLQFSEAEVSVGGCQYLLRFAGVGAAMALWNFSWAMRRNCSGSRNVLGRPEIMTPRWTCGRKGTSIAIVTRPMHIPDDKMILPSDELTVCWVPDKSAKFNVSMGARTRPRKAVIGASLSRVTIFSRALLAYQMGCSHSNNFETTMSELRVALAA
jgi:hypothetical protein